MKTKNDPRHLSRIIALQKLFEQEFNSNHSFELRELQGIDEDSGFLVIDETFTLKLVKGVIDNQTAIDKLIQEYTKKRPLEDTARIDLLILRLAIFELIYENPQTPVKVVIDEAIELAKAFGGDKSFTFINGVLGSVSADIDNGKLKTN